MKAKSIALKLFAVLFGMAVFFVLSMVAAQPAKAAGGPEQCMADTKNSAQAVNANVVTFCDETYVYDIAASSSAGVPTFVSGDKNDEGGTFTLTLVNCSGFLGVNIIRPKGTAVQAPEGKQCAALEGKENFNNQPSGQDFSKLCSMKVVQDCVIWDGKSVLWENSGVVKVVDGDSQGNYIIQNKGQQFKGPAPEKAHTTDINQLSLASSEADTCNAKGGALSFIFCPILNGIATSITWLIKPDNNFGLVQLLKLPPLQAGTPSGEVVRTVLNNIIVVVDAFYILLFLIIIFANTLPLGIDNYTVKKALPRLIVAIILTQFSFLICSIAVDIGNVLGFGVPSLLFSATAGVPQFAGVGSVGDLSSAIVTMSPFLAGAGVFIPLLTTIGIIVLVVLFIVVLFGILVAFFWLMARYLIVYFLIFLTPLAFAAMVLPGTQKYFKMWGEDIIKVLLTFPIVTGMLAGSIVISRILSNVLGAQQLQAGATYANPGEVGIKEIMVGILPIIALLAIPKTLKWSGKLSSAVGGAIGGYIGAKAGSAKNAASGVAKGAAKQGYQGYKQDAAGRLAFGARQAESAGNARGARARRGFARVLTSNYAPGQAGQAKVDAAADKHVRDLTDVAYNRFSTLNRPQAEAAFQAAAARVRANPSDTRAIAEFRAGQKRLMEVNSTDILHQERMNFGAAAQAAEAAGNHDAAQAQIDMYNYASGENLGDLSAKGPDLGAMTSTNNVVGDQFGYEVNNVTTDQVVAAHHSYLDRADIQHWSPGVISRLRDQEYRGKTRQQTVDRLAQWAVNNRTSTDPNTRARVQEIMNTVDFQGYNPQTGQITAPGGAAGVTGRLRP